MSCNIRLSRCCDFKCWLNCWMVLWIACKHFAWCWRGVDKRAEDRGFGWWAAAFDLNWFIDWRRGRRKVPSVMCWLKEGAWYGTLCGGFPQNNWAKGRLIVIELHSEIRGSEEDWGREAGARRLSDISGKRWWLPVEGLPIVGKAEMCFESSILGVGYPKRFFLLKNSGLRLYCKCWLKRRRFVLRVWLV